MPKTFAFSNKGNYWKTRYSFLPCHYSHVNKYMYSFPVSVTSGINDTTAKPLPYRHHYGADICNWYGTQTTSAVAFTFNDNVSANKMYRSLSIEGTDNVTPTALLSVNNSRSAGQIKESTALSFTDRGGILYSGLTGSQRRTNKNVTTLGTIRSTDAVGYSAGRLTLLLEMDWIAGAKSKIYGGLLGATTALFTVNYISASQGAITKFTYPSGIGSPVTVSNWQAANTSIFNTNVGQDGITQVQNFVGSNGFLVSIDFNDVLDAGLIGALPASLSDAANLLITQAGNVWPAGALGNGIVLVAVTPDNVNGGKPQGQYADLVVTLGNADYEVYGFNAYYEDNTLDHSK
jgi:hypothetical protein